MLREPVQFRALFFHDFPKFAQGFTAMDSGSRATD